MNFKRETHSDYADKLGDRFYTFIWESMTIENGCKRTPTEEDKVDLGWELDAEGWIFTQKGQRLYDNFNRRLENLFHKKYPYELIPDFQSYSGVVFP